MLGPYTANNDGTISYRGNKIFNSLKNVSNYSYPASSEVLKRVKDFPENGVWSHLSRINSRLFISSVEYFDGMGATFVPLPLTTRMISSPGAVYGKEKIDYTTDTCPITLNWFDLPDKVFLSESSQIYLELTLLQKNLSHVFSIYNSFRKERADSTHLSEFHHIEYEGNVNQSQNMDILWGLLSKFLKDCIKKNSPDLLYFITDEDLLELKSMSKKNKIKEITFKEALDLLYTHTGNEKYRKFTLKYFGPWEEVKITEILGSIVAIKEFPLLEVSFYHAVVDGSDPKTSQNADVIWPGYREIIGSGRRVRTVNELEYKAEIFNLPRKDYEPYLISRTLPNYETTSGFGMGWERLIHGLLKLNFIWSVSSFPRGHKELGV